MESLCKVFSDEAEVFSNSEIEASSPVRFSTGINELDWLYGESKINGRRKWGIPEVTISTWVGEDGVGKSRLAIAVAKNKVRDGSKVLYFQNEVDLPTLAGWINDKSLKDFYCSEENILSRQLSIIRKCRPSLVFVDSINLIQEFGSGSAKNIKLIIDGYREVIKEVRSHIIFLCQLNKAGSAVGSTALGHLPDINFQLKNTEKDGVFTVGIGRKHRYGRKGSSYISTWEHIETGVKCISNNRLKDNRWDIYEEEEFDYMKFPNTEVEKFPPFPPF